MPKPKQKHKKSKKEGDKKFKRLPWQQVFYPNRQSTRDKEQIHKRLQDSLKLQSFLQGKLTVVCLQYVGKRDRLFLKISKMQVVMSFLPVVLNIVSNTTSDHYRGQSSQIMSPARRS
jgi:hypothetical protein